MEHRAETTRNVNTDTRLVTASPFTFDWDFPLPGLSEFPIAFRMLAPYHAATKKCIQRMYWGEREKRRTGITLPALRLRSVAVESLSSCPDKPPCLSTPIKLDFALGGSPAYISAGWAKGGNMKLSARNMLKGRIKRIVEGAVNSEVTIELPGGVEVVAIITKSSTASLGLAIGKDAYAVIKASSVMVAVD